MNALRNILRRSLVGLSILALCWTAAGAAQANPKVYRRVMHSTGWVLVPSDKETVSMGACWLADKERRLAITCRHVVGNQSEALVYFPEYKDGEVIIAADHYLNRVQPIRCRVIVADAAHDLALLQLESLPAGIEALPLAAQSSRPAEPVHSIGNSGAGVGELWKYSQGVVRQVPHKKQFELDSGLIDARVIETQSPTDPGDSGGPMVNEEGQLIGVVDSYSPASRMVSYSIDVSEVKDLLENFHRLNSIKRGTLFVGDGPVPPQGSDPKEPYG